MNRNKQNKEIPFQTQHKQTKKGSLKKITKKN